jgi:hypothetical protein
MDLGEAWKVCGKIRQAVFNRLPVFLPLTQKNRKMFAFTAESQRTREK